jgi:4,5-dihydroxyphthalate decarboxylase
MATASKLELEVSVGYASMTYEIVRPLMEGRTSIEGVDLRPIDELGPTPTGDSRMKTGDFGICDLNMGYWLAAIDQGWDIVGLPLFVKRKSAYWYMIVRNDRGIAGPKDLEGRRIATRSFRSAIVTWCRGLLKNRHDVDTSTFRWLVTDSEDFFPIYDRSANVEVVQDGKVSVKDHLQRLLDGEIDAFLGDVSDPELFGWVASDSRIRRLFPDYMDEDLRLWRDESILTPVHMMVMSGKLDRQHPDLARRIYDGFEASKAQAHYDLLRDRGSFSVLYLREFVEKQFKQWGDPYVYGISANKRMLEWYIHISHEQGIMKDRYALPDVFAPSVLDT